MFLTSATGGWFGLRYLYNKISKPIILTVKQNPKKPNEYSTIKEAIDSTLKKQVINIENKNRGKTCCAHGEPVENKCEICELDKK